MSEVALQRHREKTETRTLGRGIQTACRAMNIDGVSQYLASLPNTDLARHLVDLEAAESSMSSRQERLRDLIESIHDPEGVGAAVSDALRCEEREIAERRSLVQEQIVELALERRQRLAALASPRRSAA